MGNMWSSWKMLVAVFIVLLLVMTAVCGLVFVISRRRKQKRTKNSTVTLEPSRDSMGLHTPITPEDGNAHKALEMMTSISEAGRNSIPYAAPRTEQYAD